MSQSPLVAQDRVEPYSSGWAAMGWLLRQGLSWSGRERNVCFLGQGDGTFLEAGGALGLDFPDDGRSVAAIDWDHDGDLDWILRARNTPRLRFVENRLPRRGGWVEAKLIATKTRIGARLLVRPHPEATPWMRTLRAGDGYLSQSSEWLHVGVGNAETVLLSVVWPDGALEDFGEVPSSHAYILVQGEGRTREFLPPSPESSEAKTPQPAEPASGHIGAAGRHILATPHPLPTLPIQNSKGKEIRLGGVLAQRQGHVQKPMLLLLWSQDCAPCLAELAQWSSMREQAQAAGIGLLALELVSDEPKAPSLDFLQRVDWPFARGTCPEASASLLHALAGYFTDSTGPLSVPMGFLVDRLGRIQVLYWGRAEVETVLGDLALFDLQGPARLRGSLPFDGLMLNPSSQPDWPRWAQFMRARGLSEVAEELEWGLVTTTDVNGAEAQYQIGQARFRQGRFDEALPHLERAVQNAPLIPRYLEALGNCLLQLGRGSEALDLYQRLLVVQPRNAAVLFRVGQVQCQNEQWKAAKRTLSTLLPLDYDLGAQLARLLEAAGQEER